MGVRANVCLVVVGSAIAVLLAANPKGCEPVQRAGKAKPHTVKTSEFVRTDEVFRCGEKSRRVRCGAWLYLPRRVHRSEQGKTPPVVVMANGFGSQRDQSLPKYAEEFARHGIATFLFDYRNFGSSDGQTRHEVDAMAELDDWGDAVEHVNRNLNTRVNGTRLALWGTGFSGRWTLRLACVFPDLDGGLCRWSCSVCGLNPSHIPVCRCSRRVHWPPPGSFPPGEWSTKARSTGSPYRSQHRGIGYWAALFVDIARDKVRQWMGWPRYYTKLFGSLSEHAVVPQASDLDQWMHSQSPRVPLGGWKNKVPASSALQLLTFAPVEKPHDINRPIMFIAAAFDEYSPLDILQRLITKLKRSTLVTVPNSGHYDMHPGRPHHAFALKTQLGFLKTHLFPNRAAGIGHAGDYNLPSWFDPTEHVTVEFSRGEFATKP